MEHNILDLREPAKENKAAEPVLEPVVVAQKPRKSFRNLFLTMILMLGITISGARVIQAVGAPDPGHVWNQIGDVLVSIVQGGTGLSTIGTDKQSLVVDATTDPLSPVLKYETIDKAFVGLPNVEDTALSTWTGSTNVNTLGTITTGIWNGTKIDIAHGGTNATTAAAARANLGAASTATLINTTAPLLGGGSLAANRTLSIAKATGSTDGYLTSADWNTFNNKENALAVGVAGQYYRGDKTWQTLNTDAVPEGVNQYYTTARENADFDTRIATKNTDNLTEGATNLYYTDARADGRITAQKGMANGIADLDANGKIPTSRLPALVTLTNTTVLSDEPSMLALTPQIGDAVIRTDLNKDRKSTRLNSSHSDRSRMPSSA